MMITTAKWIVIFFGVFIIGAGMVMLFAPQKARQILRMAGSTNVINYSEITVRIIPAIGLIVYADYSACPQFFKLLGWVMLITSMVLYFVPRRIHHNYALRAAEILQPRYFQWVSILAFLFGAWVVYCAV